MSFLLDTDICSAHLKEKGSLTHKFLQHLGNLHISAITAGELFTWACRAKAPPERLRGLLDFLGDVNVLHVNEAVARKFGEMRAALLDVGKTVPQMDLLIASTALTEGLTLVTHNVSDYVNVPDLRLDDWLAS